MTRGATDQVLTKTKLEEIIKLEKRTSKELQASLKKLKNLVDDIGDKFVLFSHTVDTGELLYVSDGVTEVLGISKEEAMGRPWSEVAKWYPGSPKIAYEEISSLVSRQKDYARFEMNYTHPDGSERTILVSEHPVIDENGEVVSIDGLAEDITERKSIENALRLSATAFETREAILITDARGVILSVNSSCEELTGYSANELIGKRPNILSSGRHDLHFYEAMWKALTSEGFWKGELINKCKNGKEYTEKLSITASKDLTGKVINYIGVFSDITEKIALEKQLRQSQKMEAIGILVGGIAHEFNNMLAAISGNLYLAKRKVEKEGYVRERLNTAEEVCFKAAGIIKQLLTFSRKDTSEGNLTVIDMAHWLPEGVNLARSALTSRVELKCTIEKNNLLVSADTTGLQQIIMNLINNARDASSHREHPLIEIEVSSGSATSEFRQMHKDFQGYEFVRLMVRDNGTGIPEDKLERIFEPFYTTKSAGKGTGLGMSVIDGIVKLMHGCIVVESELNVGTTFNIYIPMLHDEIKTDATKSQEEIPEGVLIGHGETILIADDEVDILKMLSEILQGLDYKVITACDGQNAVEQFERNSQSIDMVLLDVVMPKLSGPAAAILMRGINPNIPVLFLTGYNPDEMRSNMNELDNYQIFSKPIRVNELSLVVRKLFG
ncbi:PAS domain S-box-containing protein [Mariprofundus aestuarium]|uniref:histidine kinase n=1 Tax=Mariprofundus aestuarium TaxID=1921086 RepID=A0A2K8KVI6_MARES|nr:PAS domain S-box protein [Mariprofundus aestuarium]ATX78828.1 PAS domain S-box-containing protein [Mariprofundus aestuarium]